MTASYKVGDWIAALPPQPPVGTVLRCAEEYGGEKCLVERYPEGWGIHGQRGRISWRAAFSAWAPFEVERVGKGQG